MYVRALVQAVYDRLAVGILYLFMQHLYAVFFKNVAFYTIDLWLVVSHNDTYQPVFDHLVGMSLSTF